MGIQLAKRGNGYMTTTEKVCKMDGCNNKFIGVGARKFCDDHSDPKTRKSRVDNSKRIKEQELRTKIFEQSNQIIKHNFLEGVDSIQKCPCGKEFTVRLFPNIDIYPKYCEEHRNPHRRQLLMNKLNLKKESYNIVNEGRKKYYE